MSLFNNSTLSAAPTTPQKNNSLFGNNNTGGLFGNNQGGTGLFGNQNNMGFGQNNSNNLFGNNNNNNGGLFNNPMNTNTNNQFNFSSNNNNNSLFGNNNSNNMFGNNINNNTPQALECSLNVRFNGRDIVEKNGSSKFMNITALPELDYASPEELRLADYEKAKSGNINLYRIIKTKRDNTNGNFQNNQNKSMFGGTTSQGLFGNNNSNQNTNNIFGNTNNNQGGGLFGNSNNQGGGLFGNINNNQGGGLFGNNVNNNNNQGGGLFGNNNNQGGGLFGNSNNNQGGGLFGNKSSTAGLFGNSNNNNQGGGLFGNSNNNQGGGLFGNSNNNQGGGLFGNSNNNNQGGGLFGNSNNNNQGGGLFGNSNNNNQGNGLFGNNTNNNNQGGLPFGNSSNNNQGGGLFGNNNNNQGGGLFNNNNTSNNNSLFGNNSNTTGGLFGNNNNNNSTSTNNTSLFGNNNNANNNQGNSLFGNNNNSGNSLFGNNNNNNNNNQTTGGLFSNNNNNNNTQTGGLFGNNNTNTNSSNTNSLFGNANNGSLFGNNINNNGGSLFGNNNNTNNNNSLFNNNNNNAGNSLFGNNNNQNINQGQSLFGNTSTQGNNNMNNANMTMINPGANNFPLTGSLTLDDIENPLACLNEPRSMKLTPQEEYLSMSIMEAMKKQKSVNQFLEELDEKYKNKENIENDDILDNYGTYLGEARNSYNNIYEKEMKEIPTWTNNNINNYYKNSNNTKWRNMNVNNSYQEVNNVYNTELLSNSISRINNIYEEYERNKNKFRSNIYNSNNFYPKQNKYNYIPDLPNNNSSLNLNIHHSINKIRSNLLNRPDNNKDNMLAKNKSLYHQNILELSRLSSNQVKINKEIEDNNNSNVNDYDDDEDNNEIVVMNNGNDNEDDIRINGITPLNEQNTIDLTIKYRLPDSESSGNMNILKIDNVNKLIKIQTLRNEIKSRIKNELKLKGLENVFGIQKISLLVPGGFLLDNKSLQDYDIASYDFTIQAFITYSSLTTSMKKDKKCASADLIKKGDNKNIYVKENELVPFELLPKLTKEGYKCNPSILELSRKTANELRKVSGFKIYNNYGEVLFKEPVNLLGLNLDNQIVIEENLIDTGDKLNYSSIFKLYNFKVEENGLNKYKVDLKKSGGKFLEYKNNEISWEYTKA